MAEESIKVVGDFILREFLEFVADNNISSDEILGIDRAHFTRSLWEKYHNKSAYEIMGANPGLEEPEATVLSNTVFQGDPIQLSEFIFTCWPRLALAGRQPAKHRPVQLYVAVTIEYPDKRNLDILRIEIDEKTGGGFSSEGDLATIATRYLIDPNVLSAFSVGFDRLHDLAGEHMNN